MSDRGVREGSEKAIHACPFPLTLLTGHSSHNSAAGIKHKAPHVMERVV